MALTAADVEMMYTILVNSLSADESLRKPAEAALAQSESRPGFCSCLLEIIAARSAACREDVRLLSSVYFKNCITRYWRSRRDSSSCISSEEKMHLRKSLLLHIREENIQIAQQLSVLVSKIARIDYPREWPDLFACMAQQLQAADVLASHRLFMILFRTLKELSTKRLAVDRRTYAEITAQLFEYTWNIWKSDIQTILQNMSTIWQQNDRNTNQEQLDDLLLICDRWLYCLKIIRQLLLSGYSSDITTAQEIRQIIEVCPAFLSVTQSLLPYSYSFQEKQLKLQNWAKRACRKLMKVLVVLQNMHPYSFGHQDVLPAVLDFCVNIITNSEQAGTPFEQFLIQCMVLVKSVFECKQYKQIVIGRVIGESVDPSSLEQRAKDLSTAIINLLKAILTSERVIMLCNVLIKRYFIYTSKDLDEWSQNAESFHHEQNLVHWNERQRPCAEALFIVLFESHRELLSPVVVAILREATAISPPSETEISSGMLLKDAAYTAAGHVYYELSNYLNFDEWFHGSLSVELANGHPNMCIIHRRIAIILGHWISEIKGNTRILVFQALIRLLQENDVAVRLAACSSLGYLLQESNFSDLNLWEHQPVCWKLSFRLMDDVQELDSKVLVLNFMSVLLEHVGERVALFASELSQFIQKAWEESAGESLLQIQLLVVLKNFVCSLGQNSPICYPMLFPILKSGINVDSPNALNLLEDSVLLWEATLSNTPSMTPQLLELFPYLASILERSFDHLQVALSIIEDYLLFGGVEFMRDHSSIVAKLLDGIIGNVNEKGLVSTLSIVDLLVQSFPVEAPPLISGVIQKLIYIFLHDNDDRNPLRTTARATSGAIIARLLVMNGNFLAQLASDPAVAANLLQAGVSIKQNLLLCLVDMWIDKTDYASDQQKKAYALALSMILTLNMPQVIEKLDDILSICTTAIIVGQEEKGDTDSSGDITSTSWQTSESSGYGSSSSNELRRRQMKESDPLKLMSLEDVLRDSLKGCAAVHGDTAFNAAISRIHPAAFAQLQQALKMS